MLTMKTFMPVPRDAFSGCYLTKKFHRICGGRPRRSTSVSFTGSIKKELLTFKGVKRRFAERQLADMTIIDDYAHHPSEIRATLDAARQKYPDKEVIAVFQPHTFTRVIALMDDFAKALNNADRSCQIITLRKILTNNYCILKPVLL